MDYEMDYRNCLIEKANRSLNIKMGGNGDYLEKEIDIEVVREILKNGSKEKIVIDKAEEKGTNDRGNIQDKINKSKGKILNKLSKLSRNIVKKMETTFK